MPNRNPSAEEFAKTVLWELAAIRVAVEQCRDELADLKAEKTGVEAQALIQEVTREAIQRTKLLYDAHCRSAKLEPGNTPDDS